LVGDYELEETVACTVYLEEEEGGRGGLLTNFDNKL
jgi:hypothetical protein